jgi:dephospho-CoA kinase
MKEVILSISGKPGLFKLVSRGNRNLIVETLDAQHKRMPAFGTDRITSLNDVAMYTDDEDEPLTKILAAMGKKEGNKPASINAKKASSKELREYFATILPNFDRDRVHDSDIKKLISWYNILVENNITDFDAEPAEEKEEKEDK